MCSALRLEDKTSPFHPWPSAEESLTTLLQLVRAVLEATQASGKLNQSETVAYQLIG